MVSMPIGTDEFRKLRGESCLLADKSMLIAEFLEQPDKATILTRPRLFGKTLNSKMLRDFLDVRHESETLFHGLKIMETAWATARHSRPVIWLSFVGCLGAWRQLSYAIGHTLLALCQDFADIADAVGGSDGVRFHELVSTLHACGENLDQAAEVLTVLSRLACAFYGTPAVLIVDAFDTPFLSAKRYGCFEQASSFFMNLYRSALRDNHSLEKAFFAGIHPIPGMDSICGSVRVCDAGSPGYSDCFGFTKQEMHTLLGYHGLPLNGAQDWYGGYRFGGELLCAPWSIANYIHSGHLSDYWAQTAHYRMLVRLIQGASPGFAAEFKSLMANGEVQAKADLLGGYFRPDSDAGLWGLLVNAGYLTQSDGMLRIPNLECRTEWSRIADEAAHIDKVSIKTEYAACFD